MKKNKIKAFCSILLILFGVLGRILLTGMPNVETLTVVSLLAGSLLGGVYTFIVPLAAVAISDMYIGNDPIMIFTWSAWGTIGMFGWLFRKSKKDFKFGLKISALGIISSLFFFIWTNFGVWAMWNMYPHTWQGLVQCYVMAIPFFKMNLMGNLIIIPVVTFPIIYLLRRKEGLLGKKLIKAIESKQG